VFMVNQSAEAAENYAIVNDSLLQLCFNRSILSIQCKTCPMFITTLDSEVMHS